MDQAQTVVRAGGVTSGGLGPERCHVTFVDQSESRTAGSTSAGTEGFQLSAMTMPIHHQHVNPLFDIAEKMDRKAVELKGNGGSTTPEDQAKDKPGPIKRQSTKTLLKPKNALEVEVGPRDTMEKIAIRFKTTPSEICKMNKMASRMIFQGQVLYVPDPDASPDVSPESPPPTSTATTTIELMFPEVAKQNNVNTELPKMPGLPSLGGIIGADNAAVPAGTASASSQISSLFSKLNPASHISRSSLKKKREAAENEGIDVDPDEECLQRFIKLSSKRMTASDGVVNGTLLVTPNAVMFDPDVMDPLVKERSADAYGMMAPMECVMSAALFHDISPMVDQGNRERAPSGALVYHLADHAKRKANNVEPLLESTSSEECKAGSETGESIVSDALAVQAAVDDDAAARAVADDVDDATLQSPGEKKPRQFSFTSSNAQDLDDVFSPPSIDIITSETDPSSEHTANSESTKPKQPLLSLAAVGAVHAPDSVVKSERGDTVWYADLETLDADIVLQPAVNRDAADHIFASIDSMLTVNTQTNDKQWRDPPLYLRVRVGQPLNKNISNSGPIASFARQRKQPEYWFSIPKDRAPHLYTFFLQWTPEIYDNRDMERQQAFVLLGDDDKDSRFTSPMRAATPLAKDWEIVNTDEIERKRCLWSFSESDYNPMPEIVGCSKIFDDEAAKKINVRLPARAVGYPWTLVFSTEENGFSLKSLYRKMASMPDGPMLVFIKDTADKVFGAMSSTTFVISDSFYGNGEMFLFSFGEDGELNHWPWSGENNFFIKGNKESLAIGAGEGLFGLWLDEDLYHGRSHPCSTFSNECLSSKEDFVIKILEIWAFIG